MFKNVTIENFRVFRELHLDDLRQFNLLSGANNCGKTTLLEGLFLLTGPTNALLPIRINAFRNLTVIDEGIIPLYFNELDIERRIRLLAGFANPEEKRELTITPGIETESIETLKNDDIISAQNDTKSMPKSDSLVLTYVQQRQREKSGKKYISRIRITGKNIEIQDPKNYRESRKGVFVNREFLFKNLEDRFSSVQVKKQTGRIIGIMQMIDPKISALALSSDELVYCDIGMRRMVPINVLGDGMVRLFGIILAISDTENGIVFIDEIENGFHYSSLKVLWSAIFKTAKEFNVQVFASTHSYECIKAFTSSYNEEHPGDDDIRLYRIENENHTARAISLNREILSTALESDLEIR